MRELRLAKRLLARLDARGTAADAVVAGFLGSKYAVPKPTRLRIMVPEAFAPWTSELQHFYELGRLLLEVESKAYALQSPGAGGGRDNRADSVNGLRFGPALSDVTRHYLNDDVLCAFVRQQGLDEGVQQEKKIDEPAREAAKSLKLLVGAVYTHHGDVAAREFVRDKILGGVNGLAHLAAGSVR